MKTREEKINEVISIFGKWIRGAGDAPGVEDRVKDYMKEFIEPVLQKDWDVLDAGAGDCFTSEYLCGKINSWIGINQGIDLSNNIEKYNIVDMDFHDLRFDDDSFDLVLAVNTLEHSYFPSLYLFELRRVTKEYIFLDFPLSLKDGGLVCHQENPDHHFLMDLFLWEKMFKIIGLEVIKKNVFGAEIQYLLRKTSLAIAS